MRIAVVCYPTYGGSGAVAVEVAQQLAIRGHDLHVVSYERPFRLAGEIRPNLTFHAVDVGSYPLFRHPPYELHLVNRLVDLVEEQGIDIIHSHYAIPHASAAWNAREVLRTRGRDVKLACTLHGTDITLVGQERGFHELTRFAIHRQDLLTAPSRWLAAETSRTFGTAPARVLPIANAVDPTRFRPDRAMPWRSSIAPNGEAILTHVSNFRPVKRVEEVVHAFAVVAKRLPAVLALVGDGPELPKAEALARELGVRDRVKTLGLQAPEPILQASDLFLLPSVAESFGLAALEAMACGVPVLGYRAGGLPEVVEHGVSGILCEPGGHQCLGSLAADLLNDRPRHQAMRAAALARAAAFAPGPIVDQYERALAGLVGAADMSAKRQAYDQKIADLDDRSTGGQRFSRDEANGR